MLRCKDRVGHNNRAVRGGAQGAARSGSRQGSVLLLILLGVLASGCRIDMQDQPKMKPYRSSPFFKDGLSSRQLVPGTVPRGWLREDKEFFTGKKAGQTSVTPNAPGSNQVTTTPVSTAGAAQVAAAYPDDVDKFPFPVTKEILDRGEGRYQIFCTVCHGPTGTGDGMIVRRGFRKPPSFHDQSLRLAPVGHYFDVVTNGWGAMPSYAAQIPVPDRWAVIAYVRALQLTRSPNPEASPVPPTSASPKPTPGGQK